MDENYDIRLKNLTNEVNKVSDEKSLSSVFTRKINNIYIYTLVIPVIITIILVLLKPSFIMYKKINEPEVISYKKLAIVFFILVVITIILNYVYFYRKKLSS